VKPHPKITKAKRTGGMAQVIEHLPDKHKVLSSKPDCQKKKKPMLAHKMEVKKFWQ
jgi:hypothetical protein